ncbi:MAG: serine hydrolase [Cryomorphaceae bacterium]|nr:serine hydrolase [Cryomorphaceae bacterium]
MRLVNKFLFLFIFSSLFANGQSLYFPPLLSQSWDTISALDAGWCSDDFTDLFHFLDSSETRGFIVLQDGKIVIEKYFHQFNSDSAWYWASAGKSLTAFLIGMAQERGHLMESDPVTQYLGRGWTSCSPAEEGSITIGHQLTMSTGLADTVSDLNCFSDSCLHCMRPPGQHWSYHNAPYTLLRPVIEQATGQNINQFLFQNLTTQTGITGAYLWLDDISVFFSRPRSMARFGLLMQNNGYWENTGILTDTNYNMLSPAQPMNPAYGKLWWLNGSSQFYLPTVNMPFPGKILPNAPDDVYAAVGKNAQLLNVAPTQGLVIVRMGEAPPGIGGAIGISYNNQIWAYLNDLICDLKIEAPERPNPKIYPNPVRDEVHVEEVQNLIHWRLYDTTGRLMKSGKESRFMVNDVPNGLYILHIETEMGGFVRKVVKH